MPNPPPLSTASLPSASKQNASSVSAPLPKKPKRPRPLADSALFAQREAEYEQALAEYGKAMAARKITQASASPAPMAHMARPEDDPHGSSRGALEQGRLMLERKEADVVVVSCVLQAMAKNVSKKIKRQMAVPHSTPAPALLQPHSTAPVISLA